MNTRRFQNDLVDNSLSVNHFNLSPNDLLTFPCEMNSTLSVSHINIRSINANFDELQLLFETALQSKFKIIGISEIWHVDNPNLYKLFDYNFEYQSRNDGRGGGVAMYLHSELRYTRMRDIAIPNTESLWMNVEHGNTHIIVGTVYRKPGGKIDDFCNSLNDVLHQMSLDRNECIILGDFNINLLSEDDKTSEYISMMECYGLQQLVKTPTRITRHSSSLIDHIYSNISSCQISAGTILADMSDHLPVFALFECYFQKARLKPHASEKKVPQLCNLFSSSIRE